MPDLAGTACPGERQTGLHRPRQHRRGRALPEKQKQHSLLPLLHAFAQPLEPVAGSGIPTDRFRAAVREAKIGSDKDIPHISAALIRKYATDLATLGLS